MYNVHIINIIESTRTEEGKKEGWKDGEMGIRKDG